MRNDSTSCSFSLYINSYESIEKRKKATKDYKRRNRKDANFSELPTFSISFISFNKPVVLADYVI